MTYFLICNFFVRGSRILRQTMYISPVFIMRSIRILLLASFYFVSVFFAVAARGLGLWTPLR